MGVRDVARPPAWDRRRLIVVLVALAVLTTALPGADRASGHPEAPTRQQVTPLPIQQALEPRLTSAPQDPCGPNSRPETGIQGRVSRADHESGRAAEGFTCNTELTGSYTKPNVLGSVGGFKVERYVDAAGHECAYYDTTLLFPTNIFDGEAGVNVLDMSDPAHPQLTDRLITPAMLSPHESLIVNQQRGILAAVLGNPVAYPGLVDVYDISEDCRHPVLKASASPAGILGHESGMSPDGQTFYSASPGSQTLVAVDISNPSVPVPLWIGPYDSHGLTIGEGGDRAYVAGVGSGLIILDTSEIQDRVPNPTVREIARLQWGGMSIPQNAIPVTIDDHPYVVEIDEFGTLDQVGAARIVDIGDETHPQVISNLRLAVHQPENFDAIAADPGAQSALQGYAGHYCNVPTRVDPGIVACSMILSGLRVFDIRDPYHPKEIAYFNAPIKQRGLLEASNWAMSSPSFAPERGEIWYSDGFQGFFAVRVTNGVWPFPHCMGAESTASAVARPTVGSGGTDVIVGGATADRIRTKGGADRVCAKGGRDKLTGGSGRDRLRGGAGNDRLAGGPGRDALDCGPGRKDVAIAGPRDRVRRCEKVR